MRTILVLALFAGASIASAQTFFGPSPYLQASDSPWFGMSGLVLEDAEDGIFNIAGASSNHSTVSSSFGVGLIDSVDLDDGELNGVGNAGPLGPGDAFWSSGSITITFGVAGLPLPAYAGLVWTDGSGQVTFEAFDGAGASLGTITGSHADGNFNGATAEDRFYGVHYAGGIGSIKISNPGGIEIDHIQVVPVPEPMTLTVLGLASALMLRRRAR